MTTHGTNTLSLKRFNPAESLRKPFTMLVIGKRNSGKSSLIRDFLYHLHQLNYPRVVVFSGTEESNQFFSSIIPQAYIHCGLNQEILQGLVDAQRKVMNSVREAEAKLHKPLDIDTRLVIVLDDVSYSRTACRTELMNMLFLNSRHFNISIMLSLQYLISLSPEGRANADFVLVLKDSVPRSRIRTWECFGAMFPNRKDFFTVLDQTTQNYEALVINNVVASLQPEDCLCWYKADVHLPDFRFGSRRFLKSAQEQDTKTHDPSQRVLTYR